MLCLCWNECRVSPSKEVVVSGMTVITSANWPIFSSTKDEECGTSYFCVTRRVILPRLCFMGLGSVCSRVTTVSLHVVSLFCITDFSLLRPQSLWYQRVHQSLLFLPIHIFTESRQDFRVFHVDSVVRTLPLRFQCMIVFSKLQNCHMYGSTVFATPRHGRHRCGDRGSGQTQRASLGNLHGVLAVQLEVLPPRLLAIVSINSTATVCLGVSRCNLPAGWAI